MRTALASLFAIVVLLCGCAGVKTPVHPGSTNAFDSTAYDALVTAQAAITQAKSIVAADPAQKFKTQLNVVIGSYNMALESWQAYHKLAAPGPKDVAALQDELDLLVTQLAALLKQLGVTT